MGKLIVDPAETIKVGVLFSSAGPTAYIERTQVNGVLMAIAEVNCRNGLHGREVEPVIYDPKANPQRAAELAERLLSDDKVKLIFGGYMTNTRQSLLPIVKRQHAILAYPAMYEGFEYSPNVFYGGAVPNQHIVMLARYLMKNHGKRFFLVGTHYDFPIESNRVLMTMVAEQKGQIVAERYVQLNAGRRELTAIAESIKLTRPDVVFCTVIGEAARLFHEACRDVGIDRSITTFASLTITEEEVKMMGAELAAGHITAATYFESIDSPENRRFVRDYRERYGAAEHTNAMAETAYSLTHMVLAAIGRCDSFEPDLVRRELATESFAAPQGLIRLDPDNNHFYLWPRVGRVAADGSFEILEATAAEVRPDPYLVNHCMHDCDPSRSEEGI